ncbi:MAG: rhomboid family intramembrane serine protease [Chloroflexi bacterium]|nr:rhomboid family intramembrane serine protease [Chloroflexota bacterium]
MFPIRDTIRSRSVPIVNWLIMISNVLIFFHQSSLPESELNQFIQTWALVPSDVNPVNPFTWLPFLSHIWLHGSLFHLISNMWTLLIFGDNIEDRLGSGRYLLFYILGGISAGALQYFFTTDPNIPALGASGAIAAVMGAYFLFFPRARVVTFIPIFIFGGFVEIPAIFYLGIWFLTQVFSGVASLGMTTGMGGVAWWAHIGGFLFGLLMAKPFCVGRCVRQNYSDEYYPW